MAEHRISGALLDYLRYIDPLPRSARRFQKQRDTLIAEISAGGESICHVRVAQTLGVSLKKYATLSRMIVAAEPISINKVTAELTG
jgi:DNA-directed RNA polymerase specialized sigma subunit